MKTISAITLISLTALTLYFHVRSDASVNEVTYELKPEVLTPSTYKQLAAYIEKQDFSRKTLDKGVPAFVLEQLPGDLKDAPKVQEKKRIFFLSMLPMILMANEEIAEQRKELEDLYGAIDKSGSISEENLNRLITLGKLYKVNMTKPLSKTCRTELFKRIDTIPPALALAQAATESAYGTSRFALLGNNLFGEWTFIPGTGIVPAGRPEGMTYEVRRFNSVLDSVRSYMNNLNTHKAYAALRNTRAELRQNNKPLEGHILATGLLAYSSRGEAYIKDIQAIIRHNRLFKFSSTSLRSPFVPTYAAAPKNGASI